jgi:hypothetical protein
MLCGVIGRKHLQHCDLLLGCRKAGHEAQFSGSSSSSSMRSCAAAGGLGIGSTADRHWAAVVVRGADLMIHC